MKASEAVIGKFYELEGQRLIYIGVDHECDHVFTDTSGDDKWLDDHDEITPLNVTGWDDEPAPAGWRRLAADEPVTNKDKYWSRHSEWKYSCGARTANRIYIRRIEPDDYLTRHKASGLKVGDWVIPRAFAQGERGTFIGFHGGMCPFINKPGKITADTAGSNETPRSAGLCVHGWYWPYFALEKLPDPGEGWRIATGEDWRDERCEYWSPSLQRWQDRRTWAGSTSRNDRIYRIPVATAYRPFANAEEFRPHAGKGWRYKVDLPHTVRVPQDFDDFGHAGHKWENSLEHKVFIDGTPFGIKVSP